MEAPASGLAVGVARLDAEPAFRTTERAKTTIRPWRILDNTYSSYGTENRLVCLD
jgi:hypothetical protein